MGSGTAYPSLERNSAGVLIQYEGTNSVVDFGYGNVRQLLRLGLTYHDIDRIFFTHNHPDHMCDLIYFLFSTRYPPEARTRDLEIIAAPGFRTFFDGLMKAFGTWLVPDTYNINIIEQDEETCLYDGLKVTSRRVNHIELSRGYRFEGKSGHSVAISGDTDYCDGIVELGRQADVLILECSTPDDTKVKGHLSPTPAARIAHEAGCKTLCLTHFYPPMEKIDPKPVISEKFKGNLVLADDLMEFFFS
ncbi:MAG: ribonuclease Z [Candidatus Nitronauta litoralis]|uniref:Ribonuclease Z n=1 Tax=Candidatus Nitronauta litoralis TaxID=2705533 RepID=A0A7T0BZA6_9BACT|nr:MAG: ribonuclease Z [Candidatus Nitronauta litoralis]